MPKLEYNARLLPDGHLSCPHKVIELLKLRVGSQVKVIVDKRPDKNFISLRNSVPELSTTTEAEIKEVKNIWDKKIEKIANEL